jgi:hypothetical protein
MKRLFVIFVLFAGMWAGDLDSLPGESKVLSGYVPEMDSTLIDTLKAPRFGVFTVLSPEGDKFSYVVYMRKHSPITFRRWSQPGPLPQITEIRLWDFVSGKPVILRLDSSWRVGLKPYYEYGAAMKWAAHFTAGKQMIWVWGK